MKWLIAFLPIPIFIFSCEKDKTPLIPLPPEMELFWAPTAGPYGGAIIHLATSFATEMYAASQNLGIFVSTNGGMSWKITNFRRSDITALATNSRGHVFTGSLFPDGLMRSTDKGNTWQRITPDSILYIGAIGIDGNERILISEGSDIYLSIDDGKNWVKSNVPQAPASVYSFTFNVLGHVFAGTHTGIFRSLDDGRNWHIVLQSQEVNDLQVLKNGAIFAAPAGSLQRSMDNGNTWEEINGVGGLYLAANSRDEIFSAAAQIIFHSTDNGYQWDTISTPANQIVSLAIDPQDRLFAGFYFDGIFISADNGQTWEQQGVPLASVNAMVINSQNQLLAGTERGIFLTADRGDAWRRVSPQPATANSIILNQYNGSFFAAMSEDGILRSTDDGHTWEQLIGGLPALPSTFVALTANSKGDIFALNPEVYRSTDNGQNWMKLASLPYSETILVDGEDRLYVAGYTGGLYVSTDDGQNWEYRDAGLDSLGIRIYQLFRNSTDDIYAGTLYGLYQLDSTTQTFHKVRSAPNWITAIAENSAGVFFLSSRSEGVFFSRDKGQMWEPLNEGLDLDPYIIVNFINVLACDPEDRLFAGSTRYGVYRSTRKLQ